MGDYAEFGLSRSNGMGIPGERLELGSIWGSLELTCHSELFSGRHVVPVSPGVLIWMLISVTVSLSSVLAGYLHHSKILLKYSLSTQGFSSKSGHDVSELFSVISR